MALWLVGLVQLPTLFDVVRVPKEEFDHQTDGQVLVFFERLLLAKHDVSFQPLTD
jgi:hypothetical protein